MCLLLGFYCLFQAIMLLLSRLQPPAIRLTCRYFSATFKNLQNRPWYLDVPETRTQDSSSPFITPVTFPKTDVPESVKAISNYANNKLAISEVIVFDTKHSNTTTSIHSLADFVLIGSVKSYKHLQSSNDELIKFVKSEYGEIPKSEGLITSGLLRRRNKRIGRKTNLGKLSKTENDESGWCLIDCGVDGLFINLLTEERRMELNLEELYCPKEDVEIYQKRRAVEAIAEEEDNVLIGLRRLMMKNTKRYYSTAAARDQKFYDALIIQDFEAARVLKNTENEPYITIVDALGTLPANIEMNENEWLTIFDECTPDNILREDYWKARFAFYELLHVSKLLKVKKMPKIDQNAINGLNDHLKEFIPYYFEFKKLMFSQPSREEFIQYLELCIEQSKLVPTYTQLVNINKCILEGLSIYQFSDPEIVHDSRVIKLLVRSMFNSSSNLYALNEYISLISEEFQLQHLSKSVIVEIIQTLASSERWALLFQFWKTCLNTVGTDSEIWTCFIRSCLESDDLSILTQLLDKGHLVWLYRLDVEITDELREVLSDLFSKVDGNYAELRKLLTM